MIGRIVEQNRVNGHFLFKSSIALHIHILW